MIATGSSMEQNFNHNVQNQTQIAIDKAEKLLYLKKHIKIKGRLNECGNCQNSETTHNTFTKYCKFIEKKNHKPKETDPTFIIQTPDYNITANKYFGHIYRVKSILQWGRTINITNTSLSNDDIPKVVVEHIFRDDDSKQSCIINDQIYSLRAKGHLFVTESMLKWIIRKQLIDKIGTGITYNQYIFNI